MKQFLSIKLGAIAALSLVILFSGCGKKSTPTPIPVTTDYLTNGKWKVTAAILTKKNNDTETLASNDWVELLNNISFTAGSTSGQNSGTFTSSLGPGRYGITIGTPFIDIFFNDDPSTDHPYTEVITPTATKMQLGFLTDTYIHSDGTHESDVSKIEVTYGH